jgi:ribosomal protein S18 acetylase RimI-like enzyme
MVRGFSPVAPLKKLPQMRVAVTSTVLQDAISRETTREVASTDDERTTEKVIVIRQAEPDEIDELSILIANSFAVNQQGIRRWLSRWIIYLGLIERLVTTNFAKGFEEGQASKPGDSTSVLGGLQTIIVAEAPQIDGTLQTVGVAELTSAPCPVPVGIGERPAPFVCNLAVLPEYRGLGAGRSLLQKCEEVADSKYGHAEIWLETRCTNVPALRLYQSEGYVCEGLDPDIRGEKRLAYLRKRLHEGSPELERGILHIERRVGDDGEDSYEARYDIGDGRCIVKLTFLEKNFGTLAPLVAAVGAMVGGILF